MPVSMETPPGVKRTQADRDITISDEELSATRQPQPKKQHKDTGSWKYEEDIHVGHHTNWSDVPVWANVNGGDTLVVRAKKAKTAPEVVAKVWPIEFRFDPKGDPYLALEKVEVKLEITQHFTGDLDQATKETKRDLILEYLAAKHEGRPVRTITKQSRGAEPIKDIRVGNHRHHGHLASVYAFMSNGHVRFRLHEDEIKLQCGLLLPKMAVDYDDIAFSLEYQYDTPEETKDYIKVELAELECPEFDGTFTSDETSEQSGANAFPAKPLQVVLGAVEDDGMSRALRDFEKASRSLKFETEKREEALQNRHAELTRYKAELIEREKSLNESLEDHNKLAEDLANVEHSAKAKEVDANARSKQMDAKDQELKEMERRLKKLEISLKQWETDLASEDKRRLKSFEESSKKRKAELDEQETEIKRQSTELMRRENNISNREKATHLRDEHDVSGFKKKITNLESVQKEKVALVAKKVEELRQLSEKFDAYKVEKEAIIQTKNAEIARVSGLLNAHTDPAPVRIDSGSSFGKSFHKIPADPPNAGMYTEKPPPTVSGKGPYEGLKFERYRIVQFPEVKVDGQSIQEGFEYEGTKYSLYKKDGLFKMVQDFEPGMLRQQGGRIVISWTCLKQVVEAERFRF
ncbi:hypothetical protein BDZ45DRAFT_669246 [Acephala macrosclerotiorum]|nr:hypothetical protein BDZ45DRAFT_669246 [Acephala macrosclerotiorum]